MDDYKIPELPLKFDLEDKIVLKQVNLANKRLAELKGLVHTIPNELILINSLTLQEARDSSQVENIVTTNDDLYRYELKIAEFDKSPAAKEVLRYREAIKAGFENVRLNHLLTNNVLQHIQSVLVGNNAGFRKVPGTELKDGSGAVIYRPPQDCCKVIEYMRNLESYVNESASSDVDPLIRMAIIHHQFESIHPFYDGNGRTGRILCILFLVINDLLDLPILYLSRYITQTKGDYYRLIQNIRDGNGQIEDWRAWILYILKGIELTAGHTIAIVKGIKRLMDEYKDVLRPIFGKRYKHELLNHLFYHPYTKIEYMEKAMSVKRLAATKYLERIVDVGLLKRVRVGRMNYYINERLVDLFVNHSEIVS